MTTELEQLLNLPFKQPWTVRCADCAWTSEVRSYRSGQHWAKYHRMHQPGHKTLIRKGTEDETR